MERYLKQRPILSGFSLLFVAALVLGTFTLRVEAQTPKRQIEVQATIFEYRFSTEKQLGIFYQYNRTSGAWQNSDVFLHGTENPADAPIPALDLSGSFAKIRYGSIDYNLKTAIEEGRATIIGNPTVLATDGKNASISSGEKVPLTKLELQGNKTKLKLEFRNTGVKFKVTPRIFKNNYIILNLEIESSEITGFEIFDRGDRQRFELPIVQMRNIQSTIILPSGSTLYIGGLYTKSAGELTRKIPVLGDLPGLGFFLRGFNKAKYNTETIFRITPIIRNPGNGLDPTFESSFFGDLLRDDDSSLIEGTKSNEAIFLKESSADERITSPTDILNQTMQRISPQMQEPKGEKQESTADKGKMEKTEVEDGGTAKDQKNENQAGNKKAKPNKDSENKSKNK